MSVSLANSRVVDKALKKCRIGLVFALPASRQRVIVRDGDDFALMNPGGLTTPPRYRTRKLVHVIFDNESLFSAGGFSIATARDSNLAAVASASGIPHMQITRIVKKFSHAFNEALHRNDLSCTVVKVKVLDIKEIRSRSGAARNHI